MTNNEKQILNNLLSSIETRLVRLYRHYRLNEELVYGDKLTDLDLQNLLVEILLDVGQMKKEVNNGLRNTSIN